MTNEVANIASDIQFEVGKIQLVNKQALIDNATKIRDRFTTDKEIVVTEQNLDGNKAVLKTLKSTKKALDEERLKIQREYRKPLDQFNSDVKEALSIIDEAINPLDDAISSVEEQQKLKRKEQIINIATDIFEKYEVDISKLEFNSRWMNKTYSRKQREDEIIEQATELRKQKEELEKNAEAVTSLANGYQLAPEPFIQQLNNGISLADVTTNITNAAKQVQERKERDERLAKAREAQHKAELEAKTKKVGDKRVDKETGEVVEEYRTFRFTAKINREQGQKLVQFMRNNDIPFETEAM